MQAKQMPCIQYLSDVSRFFILLFRFGILETVFDGLKRIALILFELKQIITRVELFIESNTFAGMT